MNKLKSYLLLSSIFLVGCSSDDDTTPEIEPMRYIPQYEFIVNSDAHIIQTGMDDRGWWVDSLYQVIEIDTAALLLYYSPKGSPNPPDIEKIKFPDLWYTNWRVNGNTIIEIEKNETNEERAVLIVTFIRCESSHIRIVQQK